MGQAGPALAVRPDVGRGGALPAARGLRERAARWLPGLAAAARRGCWPAALAGAGPRRAAPGGAGALRADRAAR